MRARHSLICSSKFEVALEPTRPAAAARQAGVIP